MLVALRGGLLSHARERMSAFVEIWLPFAGRGRESERSAGACRKQGRGDLHCVSKLTRHAMLEGTLMTLDVFNHLSVAGRSRRLSLR